MVISPKSAAAGRHPQDQHRRKADEQGAQVRDLQAAVDVASYIHAAEPFGQPVL